MREYRKLLFQKKKGKKEDFFSPQNRKKGKTINKTQPTSNLNRMALNSLVFSLKLGNFINQDSLTYLTSPM
jgi:hypothetical protein